jgi:hypothetical protein
MTFGIMHSVAEVVAHLGRIRLYAATFPIFISAQAPA